jgi:hypothetical protein
MSIAVMKQALEALENHTAIKHPQQRYYRDAAIDALRQAIEQAEQAQPVAWIWKDGTITADPDRADGTWTPLYTALPQRKPLTQDLSAPLTLNGVALYPRQQPLTDEEIVKMAEANLHAFSQYIDGGEAHYEGEIDFARAIEAAHGIKGEA